MTVTDQQMRAITFLAAASRPNGARRWDHAGIMAALAKVADRGLAEVIMATIRAASDRDCETPGVIPGPGSHWAESASVRSVVVESAPVGTRCTVCGLTERQCRTLCYERDDHDYTPPRPRQESEYAAWLERIRAELTPTSGPTERRTLDDLAEANPQLHARLETLRAANPGLRNVPLQEVEGDA